VHECPVFPDEWMAIAAVHRGASGCSDMCKKQFGLNVCGERSQVVIVPSRQDILEEPWCRALTLAFLKAMNTP